jgi:tRNA1Val (adenine37-N6)-methyltransferase
MKVTTDACLFGAIIAKRLPGNNRGQTMLDIGTGTGLLALMVLQKDPLLEVDAVEIDPEASAQALENFNASPWKKNIHLINADIIEFSSAKEYDLIISNPPFYENELRSPDARKNLAHHNAELPLKELLKQVGRLLKKQGKFWLLLPYKRSREIRQLMEDNDLAMEDLIMVRQSTQHDYFRLLVCGSHKHETVVETSLSEISITNEDGNYTEDFVELLRNYYLKL